MNFKFHNEAKPALYVLVLCLQHKKKLILDKDELMWGLVNMAYVCLPLLIKRLSSYIRTLVVRMMLFSFFF